MGYPRDARICARMVDLQKWLLNGIRGSAISPSGSDESITCKDPSAPKAVVRSILLVLSPSGPTQERSPKFLGGFASSLCGYSSGQPVKLRNG